MSQPYQPVPSHVRERLTIAALCGEQLDLYWQDEQSMDAFVGRVHADGVVEEDGMEYLVGRNERGETVRIRLDLIRNMPTPVK